MSIPNAQEARRRFKEGHGHYPGEGPVAGVTAEQQKLILEAIQSRDRAAATATAPAYSGKGYMELVEEYKDKRRCGIMEAAVRLLFGATRKLLPAQVRLN